MSENIDEKLGADYLLENSIEGEQTEIDDASADGDEAFVASLAAAAAVPEVYDLTLEDTDDETGEFNWPISSRTRPKKRLRNKKHHKKDEDFQVAAGINKVTTSASSDGDSSVTSRFSANDSDQEKVNAARPPEKKRAKKMSAKKIATKKKPAGKKLPTRARKTTNTASKSKSTTRKKPSKKALVKGEKLFACSSDDMDVIPIDTNYNLPLVTKELKDVYFLLKVFNDTWVHEKSYSPDQKSPVEPVAYVNGRKYELLYSKFVEREQNQNKSHKYLDGCESKYCCAKLSIHFH
jgi:hypothetical protein